MPSDRADTTSVRKHAAIMFTDIVGYTALMGLDEDRAFETLQKNREIHTKCLEHFNGTLIKEMGDGMLISFDLASDAVRCAIEIQKASKSQSIPLKMGIHEGEMVFNENDVLGDGVNIASRIQDRAAEGRILVSEPIYQDIRNKKKLHVQFVERAYLKNVEEPINIYQICYDGGPAVPEISERTIQISKSKKGLFKPNKVKLSGVLAVIIAIVALFILNSSKPVPFDEEDWVIIADFENLTGDSIFDRSLNTALEVSLQQSVFVNVYPSAKMNETLVRMGMDKTTRVDEESAIEIANREGIKVVVICSISQVGEVYSLSSRIVEVATRETLRSSTFKAQGKNQILRSLDRLGRATRRELGESLNQINYELLPLPQATTSSMPLVMTAQAEV